jgi:Ca2+-binding RTX toxin-like protein
MFGTGLVTGGGLTVQAAPVGQGFTVSPADLSFILDQIKIAEAHVESTTELTGPCSSLVGSGPNQIANPLLSFGLRTVDGSCNNLQPGQETFGAADQPFPRLTTPVFSAAEDSTVPGLGPVGPPGLTSYASTGPSVVDSEPRTISNLIVDQTSTNPAAIAAAGFPVRTQGNEGVVPCTDPLTIDPVSLQPVVCVPEFETLFIPNVTTDIGLSPPYNSLFTIFGQFFDHGLDKITNGGNGAVFVPLKDDDPLVAGPDHSFGTLDDLATDLRFMVVTRGTIVDGADGFRSAPNTDSPFVDQSQTYTSHSSHQVFTREYAPAVGGPVSTGMFLSSADGGLPTWAMVKAQAAALLGLQLVDADVTDIPMIATDVYGNFIPGTAHGLPQYVTQSGTVEGCRITDLDCTGPVAAPADVLRIGTAFLNDIAHSAGPGSLASPKTADADSAAGGSLDPVVDGEYDNELLDLHFICGDGRCNENIALSAIHQVFHSEHDRLIGNIQGTLAANTDVQAAYQATNCAIGCATNDPNLPTTFTEGQRLFQAARFVTEMEYQHLVFEEFARKVQPAINPFEPFAFNQTDVNPAITAEFAHAVYRFGHSMLTETIARTNEDGSSNDIPLLDGFLNPAAYTDGGPGVTLTSQQAAGSIIMGLSDQVGNELDEFVTETLRNHLLGLPLDLPSINMARARSEGIPSLNNLRKQIFAATNDGQLTPYTNWVDFGLALKHPESLTNFVAAYGRHPTILAATTLADKREAARLIVAPDVLHGESPTPGAADFMGSTGLWANTGSTSITGVDDIDLWVGGLAEITNPFGGLLGTTFNYVFENQLTNLQNGDRFYYLARTPGMNLRAQLEGNSFAELMMRNTTAHTLKADSFATADCKFQMSNLNGTAAGYALLGSTVADDVPSECLENELLIRMPSGQIRYRTTNSIDPPGINGQSVYNGTAGVDRIFGGNDNDTFLGNEGNDIIEGGAGDDIPLGGDGNDIMTDLAGDDVQKGGPGNDALDGGIGLDILMGGDGADFTNGGGNTNEAFLGAGNDFAIAGQGTDAVLGDSGDDWIEGGDMPDLLIGDSSSLFFDDHNLPGNDVTIGQGGDDDYDTEGGDDILVAGPGVEKNAGASGFDWSIGLNDPQPQVADLNQKILGGGQPAIEVRDRFNEVEALSGWNLNDTLIGEDLAPATVGGAGFIGCDALDQDGLDRIAGLDALVPTLTTPSAPIIAATTTSYCLLEGNVWGAGNILLGGAGSDTIEGRGADDIIDGDRYVNVRLSVRTSPANPASEIGTTDLLEHAALGGTFGAGTAGMTLQQAVFAGLVDPGNIAIVREIITPSAAQTVGNIDTAVFSGPQADYDIGVTPASPGTLAAVTVAHVRGTAADGIDTLRNVEQASFCNTPGVVPGTCDVPRVLVSLGFPSAGLSVSSLGFGTRAIGAAAVTLPVTLTNTGGGTLTVSGSTISGANATSFSATSNCTNLTGGATCTFNVSFAPTAAGVRTAQLNIATNAGPPSVVALTGTGVVNTPATGAATISDTTPTEGTAVTASTATIADVNGVPATLGVQWSQSALGGGGALTPIAGATGLSFTPLQAQVNRRLAVVVTFVDLAGSAESRTSLSTTVVGDLFLGTAGVDTLTGTAGQDDYHGGASADNLSTVAENDNVSGDAGNDTISTGAGNDNIWFTGTGEGFDAVTGGADVDTIHALTNNTNIGLRSIATVEVITADGHTGVRILGSTGNDVLDFTGVTLTGIAEINGGGGNDSLTGSAGADVLVGLAGNDTVNGGNGIDILEGGAGNDTMNSGAGNDFFRFSNGFGADTINGFDATAAGGQDLIDLRAFGIVDIASFVARVTVANNGGGRTLITVTGGGTIRLNGVGVANVNIGDFLLA